MKKYEELLEKDKNGNIIFEQHSDGFQEISYYDNDKLIKQVTKYSNGIIEIDHYIHLKEE